MAATPAGDTAGTLTIADLTGQWAADTAACSTPSEVTTITATTFSGGGLTRTVTSATPGTNGLDVVLTGTVDNAPVTETWTRPLWHAPWVFLLALACFAGEWLLRRRRGVL